MISGETATQYRPDLIYTPLQALRDILDGRDRDDLLALGGDLQEQVEAWQAKYDAGSPRDLREQAAHAETATGTRAMRRTANN